MYSVVPLPGGPSIKRLCGPAAAITGRGWPTPGRHIGVVIVVGECIKQFLKSGRRWVDFQVACKEGGRFGQGRDGNDFQVLHKGVRSA